MEVTEIIHPEEETAERWSKKLNLQGVVDSFEINNDYSIVETAVPDHYAGKTLEEIGLKRKYNIIVLTTLRMVQETNMLAIKKNVTNVQGVASARTVFHKGEIMVLYGHNKDLKKLLKDQDKY